MNPLVGFARKKICARRQAVTTGTKPSRWAGGGCPCDQSKGIWLRFLVSLVMEPTEEQLTALGNYRDIIIQHVPEIAEAIGVSPQTLTGWMEDKRDPTSEQAEKILEFLTKK